MKVGRRTVFFVTDDTISDPRTQALEPQVIDDADLLQPGDILVPPQRIPTQALVGRRFRRYRRTYVHRIRPLFMTPLCRASHASNGPYRPSVACKLRQQLIKYDQRVAFTEQTLT